MLFKIRYFLCGFGMLFQPNFGAKVLCNGENGIHDTVHFGAKVLCSEKNVCKF